MKRFIFFYAMLCLVFSTTVLAAEKFKVASDCTWPPMELLNDKNEPDGYSVDYLKEAARAAGFEVENLNIAWDGIFGGLMTGKYDIIASSTTITPERAKEIAFSDPYYEVVQAVVVPKGQSISSLNDLKGKNVGGQIGTTGIFVMREADTGANLREYDDVGLAMQDLVGGRLDAVICDDPVAMYYANKKPDTADKLDLTYKTDATEKYGFAINKNRPDIVELVNKGIKLVKESGKEAELKKKWMGE